MIRKIDGLSYSFVQNEQGWAVLRLESRTDSFGHNYQVYTFADGSPKKCTCGSCVRAWAWCKHCREVEAIRREADPTIQQRLNEEAARCGFSIPVVTREDLIDAGMIREE